MRAASRRFVPYGLAWLIALSPLPLLRAHHIDFITVTADFQTDRRALSVTVSVEALRVLEETQSTALAAELQKSGGPAGEAKAEILRAAARFLNERLRFFTDTQHDPLDVVYEFSLISVPDAAADRSDLFVVGRGEGELPAAVRSVETELSGGMRAMLIRKVDGEITSPALTVLPSPDKRTVLAVPAVRALAANEPVTSRSFFIGAGTAGAIIAAAGALILVFRMVRR